ncbi:MAG TPA: alpha/beta hydrolase-fold protein [Solirubrobacteraceae bacterium]|jgi:enterochelin esterase-like enzyme
MRASRGQVWLDSLDWSWPGQGGAAVEVLPPPWIPAFPPRRAPAVARPAGPPAWRAPRTRGQRLLIGVLLSVLASFCLLLARGEQTSLASLVGLPGAGTVEQEAPAISSAPAVSTLPTLEPVSQDAAGSAIVEANYSSPAVHGIGSFLAYLPPGYGSTAAHYPVFYLLTGNDQSDSAFLQIGIQSQLDRLISRHEIPPVIAVMIQGGPGSNNWRNAGALRYERYILEVQEMVDRMLPTVPTRSARAVMGDSMGAYGAMNVALSNPYRFSVVESWLGFFNGLEGDLRTDRPVIKRLGLHAFVYGGEQDHIANPAEDLPFAAALRGAGANADGAIYPGEHNLGTVEAHLTSMLTFAGRSLGAAKSRGTS